MPELVLRMLTEALPLAPPYWTDASTPQYILAGDLSVRGLCKPR
jgi:hypothetical protein